MSKPNDFRPILVNLVQTIPTPQVSAEKGRTCLSAGCRCMQYPNGKGGPQRIEKGFKNQSSNLAGSWYGVDIQVQLWCVDATWEQWYSQYAGCSIHVDIWLRFPQKKSCNQYNSNARSGMLKAVQLCLQLRPDGLATAGVPCHSFVWVNSGTAQRTHDSPFGREDLDYIAAANTIATRTCLLWMLCTVALCIFS